MNDDIVDAQIRALRAGSEKHWKQQMAERGVRGAWPELLQETGGDHVAALRLMTRALDGAYIGPTIDPETNQPTGESTVLDATLSRVILGPPRTGKSTRWIIPGAIQSIANGMRALLATPQPKTVADAYRAALAAGDADKVWIMDFGAQLVEQGSPRLTTWDPTSRCSDAVAAREFAAKLAGPGSPVAEDLGSGTGAGFWLQVPEVALAAAAHLTSVEREMKRRTGLARGMTPEEAAAFSLRGPRIAPTEALTPGMRGKASTGISRVFHYLRRPLEPDPRRQGTPFEGLSASLRSELTPGQRDALRDHPARMREMEEIVQTAAYNAASYPLSLQKLVYNRALLELQGAPVDLGLVGGELADLKPIVENIAQRESDPTDQLANSVKRAIPALEQRVLTPQEGDVEVSPEQIVRGPSGLYIVSYDSSGRTGLAPGWFCDEVIKGSFRYSKELAKEDKFGGEDTFGGVSVWVDEGGALKHMDFDHALKEGRQHRVVAAVSATSAKQLVDEIGEARANMILASSPITVNLAPTSAEASEIADSFGQKKTTDVTHLYQSDSAGYGVSVAEHDAPRVTSDRIKNLRPGEAVVTDTAGEERRDTIVHAWPFYERGNPVGDTIAAVNAADGPDMPWEDLLPETKQRLDAKRLARQPLAEPSEPEVLDAPPPGALRRLGEATKTSTTGIAAPAEPPSPAPLHEPRRDPTDL